MVRVWWCGRCQVRRCDFDVDVALDGADACQGGQVLTGLALQRVCAAYALGVGDCVPLSARVTRMSGADSDVVIKVFGADEILRARTEVALLQRVAATKSPWFRGQQLLLTATEAPSFHLDGHPVLVTRFQAGIKKKYSELSAYEWGTLGTALAALHDALEGLDPAALPLPSLHHSLAHLDVPGEIQRLAQDRKLVQEREGSRYFDSFFDARALLLRERGTRCRDHIIDGWTPIHNDYNENNYLFTVGLPPLIIDWDRAIIGIREYEVVRCLNHLPLLAPHLALAFIDGYRARHPLRGEALAWSVDASFVSHALKHWPVGLCLRGEDGARDRLVAMAEMVDVLLRRRRELDSFFHNLGPQA